MAQFFREELHLRVGAGFDAGFVDGMGEREGFGFAHGDHDALAGLDGGGVMPTRTSATAFQRGSVAGMGRFPVGGCVGSIAWGWGCWGERERHPVFMLLLLLKRSVVV